MSRFLHFTVAVEYNPPGRMRAGQLEQIADEIRNSLLRHATHVTVDKSFDAVDPKIKRRVLPLVEQPESRGNYGWHLHDNDSACTPCSTLYSLVHEETL